ncbi:MAG: outer membrane beta-barrel protein [Candidatus Cryptobacteroides sp.]
MKKICSALFCLLCSLGLLQASEKHIKVNGTSLADMSSAMDVLLQQTGIRISGDVIYIDGKYKAAVYVEDREVREISRLGTMPASQIDSIVVILNPNSEYDKNINAAIRIVPLDKRRGFKSETQVRMDVTHTASFNVDQYISWQKGRFSADAAFSFHDTDYWRDGMGFVQSYVPSGGAMLLDKRTTLEYRQNVSQRILNGSLNIGWRPAEGHRLELRYEIISKPESRNYFKVGDRVMKKFQADGQGLVDPDNPVSSVHQSLNFLLPDLSHELNLSYGGEVDRWQFTGEVKLKFDVPTASLSIIQDWNLLADIDFSRRTLQEKSRLSAKRLIGNACVTFGVSDTYDRNDAKYEDKASPDNNTHARVSEHTSAIFASISNQWEHWSLTGGIRYEYTSNSYVAYEDDGTLAYLKEHGITSLEISRDYHRVHPDASVSWFNDNNKVTLSYAQSVKPPYYDFSRIVKADVDNPDASILKTELQHTTSLTWKYRKWLQIGLSHTYFRNPLYATTNDFYFFNGDNYNAVDANLVFSPKVGFWQPVLNLWMHKQWNYMPTANGVNKLSDPMISVQWNNCLQLPHKWNIYLNASYTSRGSNRNIRIYTPDFNLDASIQKNLWKDRITLSFSAHNILRTHITDLTLYSRAERGTSDGFRNRYPSVFSITAILRL